MFTQQKQNPRRLVFIFFYFSVLIVMGTFTGVARSEYPERPVTIIVGFPAGGAIDLPIRAIAMGSEKYLGQPIIVENRPGGSGQVSLSMTAAAKPDGYTLCGASANTIIRVPLMQKVTTYKPLKSFTPIIGYASSHNALVVKSDAPWKTFKELIDYAKKNPGKIKYSTAGIGTSMHHAMEYLALKEAVKWVHIPDKGNIPAITALLGGHVDACSSGSDFSPYAKSGRVRALAVYIENRLPAFPDVPTLRELGYDFAIEQVFCIVGPAGLPPEVVRKLENAFKKGLETPQFKLTIEQLDNIPVYYNSEDFGRFLKEIWFKLEKSLKETGIIKEAATQPY